MALVEHTLFGIQDKVQIAIDRIRQFEPPEGYYVAFSGGKDSCVVLDLIKRAGVKYDAHYNLTTVDPPELVNFIRDTFKVRGRKSRYRARKKAARLMGKKFPRLWLENMDIHYPAETMWELIPKKSLPPTRKVRYCCAVLKEGGGIGRVVTTGVRWQESARRSKRRMVETCNLHPGKRYLHAIIDWSKEEVWEYIHVRKLPYCSLYDEGFKRIGCVMCPMGGTKQMMRDAERWPTYAKMYRTACHRAYEKCVSRGKKMKWQSGDDMYEWWISGKAMEKQDPDQTIIFE